MTTINIDLRAAAAYYAAYATASATYAANAAACAAACAASATADTNSTRIFKSVLKTMNLYKLKGI